MAWKLDDIENFDKGLRDYSGSGWTLDDIRTDADKDGGGALGPVFEFLDYFDRPRNVVASVAQNVADDDPRTTALSGITEGITGEQRTPWGDVIGLESAGEDAGWPEWLARGGSRLALDMIFDPLNLAFGAGAITKGLGLAGKGAKLLGRANVGPVRKAIAGSDIGKGFYSRLPRGTARHGHVDIDYNDLEDFISQTTMAGKPGEIRRLVGETDDELKRLLEDPRFEGVSRQDVFEAMERPGFHPELQELVDVVDPLRARNRQAFDEYAELFNKHMDPESGLRRVEPIEDIPGDDLLEAYTHAPRIRSALDKFRFGEDVGRIRRSPAGLEIASDIPAGRQILKWYPESGAPIVGKFGMMQKRHGLQIDEAGNYTIMRNGERVPVEIGQASLRDLEGIPMSARGRKRAAADLIEGEGADSLTLADEFIRDPVEALRIAASRNQARATYMRIVDKGITDGWLTKLDDIEELPRGFRQMKVPGFENYVAPKPVAVRMENLFRVMGNPEGHAEGIEKFMRAYMDTTFGQLAKQGTNWWKRNILLLFPGFHFANMISNLSLMYLGNVRNPARLVDAWNVLRKPDASFLSGITNRELIEKLTDAGLLNQNAMQYIGDLSREASSDLPILKMITGRMGKAGTPIQKTSDYWRWANDNIGAKTGQAIEDHARLTVVLDQLKKTAKTGKKVGDEDIFRAARHATDMLFDYGPGGATPLEQQLKHIFPFYSWTSGIVKKTARDAIDQPQELANIGRITNALTDPFTQEEKGLAPDWMQDQGPVKSVLGGLAGGAGKVLNVGRFVPHGTIEQFMPFRHWGENKLDPWKPVSEVANMVNPLYKTPLETLTNRSLFKNEDIDPTTHPITALGSWMTGGNDWTPPRNPMFNVQYPAAAEHLVLSSPVGRHMRVMDTMLRGITHDAPGRDPLTKWDRAGYFLTSGRTFPYTKERAVKQRAWSADKKESEIKRNLKRAERNQDVKGKAFWAERLSEFKDWRHRAFHKPSP